MSVWNKAKVGRVWSKTRGDIDKSLLQMKSRMKNKVGLGQEKFLRDRMKILEKEIYFPADKIITSFCWSSNFFVCLLLFYFFFFLIFFLSCFSFRFHGSSREKKWETTFALIHCLLIGFFGWGEWFFEIEEKSKDDNPGTSLGDFANFVAINIRQFNSITIAISISDGGSSAKFSNIAVAKNVHNSHWIDLKEKKKKFHSQEAKEHFF